MKSLSAIVITGILILFILSSACTSSSPQVPAQTPAPAAPAASQAPVAEPYPNAIALNEPVAFGSADMTGQATVYKFSIKPVYNWRSPSWRSAREQAAYAPPLDIQHGYNTEKPSAGNTFLFVFFRVTGTGTKAVYAPSPQQFVISGDGKTYSYRPVSDPDVIINEVSEKEYDFLIGKGGTGGYVQPGASNRAEGYLIYVIPDALTPDKLYVVANLDYQTTAVWRLG